MISDLYVDDTYVIINKELERMHETITSSK